MRFFLLFMQGAVGFFFFFSNQGKSIGNLWHLCGCFPLSVHIRLLSIKQQKEA